MRIHELLHESSGRNLTIGSLTHYRDRPKVFADLIRKSHKFNTVSGSKVVIDPETADAVEQELQNLVDAKFAGNPIRSGSLQIKIIEIDGEETNQTIPSGNLLKDKDVSGKSGGRAEKEQVGKSIQPSNFFGMKQIDRPKDQQDAKVDIDITTFVDAGAFKAGDLYNKIVNNPKLTNLRPHMADAIVTAANQIHSGNTARVPAMLSSAELSAFRDYAGEYLGVLALINGGDGVQWAGGEGKSKAFYEHLDKMGSTDLSSMVLYFHNDPTQTLSDSLLVSNSGKEMHISSKAGAQGHGSAPSLDGLTIPNEVRNFKGAGGRNPFKSAITFIDTAQKTEGFLQPFALANLLKNKVLFDSPFEKFNLDELRTSHKTKKISKQVQIYIDAFPSKDWKGTPLGKLRYSVIKRVMGAVNSGEALVNFKSAVLQILGYNFVQLNTKQIGGEYVTTVNWPATISGNITLEDKGGAARTGAKLSFKIQA
jgi:hypothetical protein